MNSEIANYDFHGSAVRVHTNGDTVEYCARDIATALGYTNPNKAIGDHCKGVTNRYPLATAGGVQQAVFISEGDVYRLIVSSQLPAAVEFERWLFDEVVPQIRRTGGYIPVQAADDEKSILARAVLIAMSSRTVASEMSTSLTRRPPVLVAHSRESISLMVDRFAAAYREIGQLFDQLETNREQWDQYQDGYTSGLAKALAIIDAHVGGKLS